MNANKAIGPLGERLLAFLDDGVSPVTAEEARARSGSEPRRHTDVRRQPRRSRLLLTIGFAALVIVGVFAVVSVSRRGHSASPITHPPPNRGRQVFVARLVPEGHASTEQLDSASGVLLRRLQLLGDQGAEAEVSGGSILLTTSGEVQKLRSGLSLLVSPGELLFRPVLCAVPAYSPRVIGGKSATAPGPLPTACPPQYQLTAANLNVNTDTGQPQNSVAPWPALANFPSTPLANDDPADTVLLRTAADSGFAGERLLLGPAQVDDAADQLGAGDIRQPRLVGEPEPGLHGLASVGCAGNATVPRLCRHRPRRVCGVRTIDAARSVNVHKLWGQGSNIRKLHKSDGR